MLLRGLASTAALVAAVLLATSLSGADAQIWVFDGGRVLTVDGSSIASRDELGAGRGPAVYTASTAHYFTVRGIQPTGISLQATDGGWFFQNDLSWTLQVSGAVSSSSPCRLTLCYGLFMNSTVQDAVRNGQTFACEAGQSSSLTLVASDLFDASPPRPFVRVFLEYIAPTTATHTLPTAESWLGLGFGFTLLTNVISMDCPRGTVSLTTPETADFTNFGTSRPPLPPQRPPSPPLGISPGSLPPWPPGRVPPLPPLPPAPPPSPQAALGRASSNTLMVYGLVLAVVLLSVLL